jgi:uncharacterized membrane protein YfcA
VLGESVREATTASLVVVAAVALTGGLAHARQGGVCWCHAVAFGVAALPGIACGTFLGNAAGGGALLASFAVVMVLAAGATWRRAGGSGSDRRSPDELSCPPLRPLRDLTAGMLVGLLTGFFGVGGGFLIVPTLAVFLALSMPLAVGTSLVIITATSTMGLAAHLLAGRVLDLPVTAAMTSACVAGALVGAVLVRRVAQPRLARAFACLVGAVATYLFVSAAFLGGPPGG